MEERRTRATTRNALGAFGVAVAACVAVVVAPNALATPAQSGRHLDLGGNGVGAVRIGTSQATAIRELTAQLGPPSGRPVADCPGTYTDVAWHDLIAQFRDGRFSGYRYWYAQAGRSITPRLTTANGVTLGTTFASLRDAYRLTQTGTFFWSADGMTFGLAGDTYPSPASAPVYEVTVTVCPAAL